MRELGGGKLRGAAERRLQVLGEMRKKSERKAAVWRWQQGSGFHSVVLGKHRENDEKEGKMCAHGWVGWLLVHPPEATNALTFINLH